MPADLTATPNAIGRPIRIGIDVRPLGGPPCGYTIYLGSVIECLRKADVELTLLSNRPLLPHYEEASDLPIRVFGRSGDFRWERSDLPELLAEEDFDVYFSGANRGIPSRKNGRTRYVLGLLDIIPYIFFRNYFIDNLRTWLKTPSLNRETLSQLISLARADSIITISRQSAEDIKRVFRRKDVSDFLIRLKAVEVAPAEKTKRQFVYVGGIDFRKKIDVLLEAFALFVRDHPDFRLVLVGSNYTSILPLVDRLGLTDRVVLTGYVDHETKFRILGESCAMIYPSLYEGYGLAIAEGFQAGIPVICGQGGSQEQIGGVGARLIDPLSPIDIAAAMTEMLDPEVRNGWIARGRQQLAVLTDPAIEIAIVDFFLDQGKRARAG